MENAHTAGDTEQNGHRNVLRRVMIVFAGSLQGKTQNRKRFAHQKKFHLVFFCGARSTLRFRVPLMPAKSIVTRQSTLRMRAAPLENARFRYHTPGTVGTVRFLRKMLLELKKCHFHGRKPGSESIRRVSVWSSSKNQTRDLSGGLRGLQTVRVKASDVFLCGLHPKNEAKRPFWWLRDLQTGSESIRRAFSSFKMMPRDR